MARRALIVGGGWAGCAAAWRFASRGFEVQLCEAAPRLGGRASSFSDSSGLELDNGQHLFLGAYKTALAMLKDFGLGDAIKFPDQLKVNYLFDGGKIETLQSCNLWGPLALAVGLARFKALPVVDRLSALGLGFSAAIDLILVLMGASLPRLEQLTVEKWLKEMGQSENTMQLVWEPMCLAALNTRMDQAQALGLAQVLVKGFFRGGKTSALGFADRPLSALLTPGLEKYLGERGGSIRLGCRVDSIEIVNGRATALVVNGGERLEADLFVMAIPAKMLKKILSGKDVKVEGLEANTWIEDSPIVSTWLWTSKPIVEIDFCGFAPRNGVQPDYHWFFNKDSLLKDMGQDGHLSCVVASAAGGPVVLENDDVLKAVAAQLKLYLPGFDPASITHFRVVKERTATPKFVPGSQNGRPRPSTSVANIALAGDWTQTGLPATIEGAALSGLRAAQALGA